MKYLFWVDLEMTGLDDQVDRILEAAVVITDMELNTQAEYHRVVFQPQEVLDQMNDWCKKTHGESGLTAAIPTGTPLEQVDRELHELIKRFYGERDKVVLAGNSVGNDKRFIDRYMPLVAGRLHYRLIDVTSFKEIFREKFGVNFQKANSHRAVDDIHESIKELQHYLSFVQIPKKET